MPKVFAAWKTALNARIWQPIEVRFGTVNIRILAFIFPYSLWYTTYEIEVHDFFDIDRHVGVLSPWRTFPFLPGALPLGHVRKEPPKPQYPPHLFQSQKEHMSPIIKQTSRYKASKVLIGAYDEKVSVCVIHWVYHWIPTVWNLYSVTDIFERKRRTHIEKSRIPSQICEILWNSRRCGWGSHTLSFFLRFLPDMHVEQGPICDEVRKAMVKSYCEWEPRAAARRIM